MSLSTMTRQDYTAHRASIRTNGACYTLAHIVCPFEQEDMAFLEAQTNDHLQERLACNETPRLAFLLTSPLTASPIQR